MTEFPTNKKKTILETYRSIATGFLGVGFALCSVPFFLMNSLFLAMFCLGLGLITIPLISHKLPDIGAIKQRKIIIICTLFTVCLMADVHFQDVARQKQDELAAQKLEQRRLEKVAEFAPVREETIEKIRKFISDKKFQEAQDLAKQYESLKDDEIQKLFDQARQEIKLESRRLAREEKLARFNDQRDQIIDNYKQAMKAGNYEFAVSITNEYVDVAGPEFSEMHKEASAEYQKQIQAQNRMRALLSMDVESEEMNASIFCKTVMEKLLKAPKTAEFPWGKGNVSVSGDREYFTVRSYVDAQNSFGALIRTNYTCRLKYNGGGYNGWTVDDFQAN
ncbi:MAG: hypothetical protein KDI13_09455 [Alphaproteobacteria bacterium]|nr:hypothetical protein [Alphaproteobacteria bacterium]